MPDADLQKTLSALHPPAASETARARALHRASLALAAARGAPASDVSTAMIQRRFRFALPAFVCLAAVAAVLLGFGLRTSPRADVAPDFAAESRRMLSELDQLFPGQLNAVIEREGVLQLDLASETSAAPMGVFEDQVILVELTRDGRRLRILASSGRTVRLELDGVSLRLDPLLTSTGDVLLAGDDFVWSSARPADSLAGWQIAARPLALPL